MASGPLVVKLEIKADGTAAIVGLNKVQGALDTTGKKGKEASAGISSLTASLKGLALTAGAALSVGALASSFMSANLEASKLRGQLVTATGSIQAAAAAMEVLQSFAAATPYTLAETTSAFITLKNRGLDSTIAAMTSYGNTSAALGKSIGDMAAAVADAVNGDFARAEEAFSVNAKQTGDQVAMTFRGITTTIGNNAQEIQQYLIGIGQTEFAGSLERQGKTLGGVASTLGDSWAQLMVTIGDTGAASAIGVAITELTGFLDGLIGSIQGTSAESSVFMSALSGLNDVIVSTYGELKSGAWSETTTAIMATAGAIGGAIGLMTALSAAVGIATGVWGAFTAVLLANPVTLAIAGIGALIGVLYTLRDETITIGQTTTTVGATVSAVWETTASYSEAVWNTFSSYVSGVFNSLPPVVSSAGNAVLSVWSATMSGLMSLTSGAVNYVMNLFRWIGQSAGVLAGEVAMSIESGFSFDRLREGLSGAVQYTDMLGEANQRASAGIAAAGQEIAKKAGAIAADNLETELGSVITAAHADQQHKAAMEAKLHAFEQNNLAGAHGKSTAAAKAGGAANKAAAKEAKEYEKDLDALIKQFLPARDDAEKLAEATDLIAEAHAKGDLVGKDYTEMVKKVAEAYDTATNDAQKLIDKYDTEGAKARELAEDRAKLAAVLADGTLKVEGASKAMDKLTEAEKKNNSEADAWTEVWKNAVKRIDDTFANLWEDLFSGGKSALASLKKAITSWLAEVAHALLTKPLVVAITASMTGGAGTAGAAGTVGNAVSNASGFGSLGNIASGLSSLFNWGGSALSSIFSGAVFSGISSGFGMAMSNIGAAGYFGAFTSNMALASSSFSSGAIGTAIGAAAPYLLAALPIAAIAYGIFAKYQKDQEPRYGAYAATTHGGVGQFEDNVGVRGAFGLTFGMNDKGSANIDANEARSVFEGFAKMSEAMAQFYGADVSAQVEASLKKISEEHYAKTGILNYAMDVNQAFDVAFSQIIDAAAATGDAVAVVMKAVVGDLSGTAQDMAKQIETGMNTTAAVIQTAKALEGTDTGKLLELGTDLTANALRLVDYANAIKWTGETTAAALGRMGQYITVLNTALDLSGNTVDLTGQAFIDLARNLAYAADVAKIGIEGLLQLQAYYFDQFFSAEEKFTRNIEAASKAITDSFKELNLFPTKDIKVGGVVDPLLFKDRQAFMDLVDSLDLSTESGRKFYVELMKLAPAFDAIFDGVEAFMGWLRPQDQLLRAEEELNGLFAKWGITMPKTRAEFEKLVASGALTTEQMAILGGHLDALNILFPELSDAISAAQQNADLQIRLAEAKGDDELALRLRREQELKTALDDTNRSMLLYIYALEDANNAMNKAYAALERAVAEERKKIEDTYQARVDAINAEREAINKQMSQAQEALSKVSGIVSSITSALEQFREVTADNGMAMKLARQQLSAWAATGILPKQDAFDRVMSTLSTDDKNNYTTELAYKASQQGVYANLLKLETLGTGQKTFEEQQIAMLEAQAKSLDDQLEQAAEWRDSEMDRLDAILEDAKKRMEIALGTYLEVQSIDDALDALNTAMSEFLKLTSIVPTWPGSPSGDIPSGPYLTLPLSSANDGENSYAATAEKQSDALEAIKGEIIILRKDLAAASTAQVVPLVAIETRLRRWDMDGFPESSASSGTALRVA